MGAGRITQGEMLDLEEHDRLEKQCRRAIEQAKGYYPPSKGSAHGFEHVLRVTTLAERIAKAEGADLDVVRAAALLHDIAADGPDRDQHHQIGAQKAVALLRGMGLPEPKVREVAHCIQSHRFRSPQDAPQTLEAKCVFDISAATAGSGSEGSFSATNKPW